MAERILVIEDDRELRDLLTDVLRDAGYEVVPAATAEAGLRTLAGQDEVDLVLTDLMLPGMQGSHLLGEARRRRPELHVVVMTAFGSIESAIELVKSGAFDYLTKPLGTDELLLAVERALADSRRRREIARQTRDDVAGAPAGLVGRAPVMQELYRLIGRAATSPHAVLVAGESGTGKELVARALHRLSGRDAFVTVNCGALPDQLMESELFGHERGAFTGADRAKDGLFQVAHRGTLLLDEIAELPLALQPKLLRVLELGEARRVGATRPQAVDVRVVAATNRDLEAEVAAGRFRDDLFWRLNVLTIRVPPLRERAADIPALAEYFLGQVPAAGRPDGVVPRLTPATMAALCAYHWPGNVRELRNTILRATTLAAGPEITPADLPDRVREGGRAATLLADAARRHLTVADLERLYVLQVLAEAGGNKSRAAEILGMDRKTLYRKLEEYRTDTPSD
jgi:DNA-binding NtrC family response regulator